MNHQNNIQKFILKISFILKAVGLYIHLFLISWGSIPRSSAAINKI